ncbi:MAG: DegT/DnrJ/EryC1/StrS family aminotransferase [Clostridia bacterium]|nr:DegT/DnrJ/EryC1/StrS family aminotransferase [Clostridia bacterium]
MFKKQLAISGGSTTVPQGIAKSWPVITEADEEVLLKVLRSGKLWGTRTPEVVGLQEDWANYVGVKHCLAPQSGTAALHMAVAAAGLEPGDEVITSAFTFIASASCVLHHNGIPIFADIDPKTCNIDPKKIEEKITDRTRAIIPVHIHGLPADMDEINAIAKKHNLLVIEDACQAHGATYKGKKTGALGDMACFSLNGSKNLSGGEGGLFVTDNDDLLNSAASVAMFGEIIKSGEARKYNASHVGWMYRIQEFSAAFARSQLRRLDEYNAIRKRNCEYLTERLSKIKGIKTVEVPDDRTHVYFMYRVRFDPHEAGYDIHPRKFREIVEKALYAEGVLVGQSERAPVMAQDVFQKQVGYGKGCPWKCTLAGRKVEYVVEDYPEAVSLCNDYTLVRGIHAPNGLELMKAYVEAFEKVFNNLDEAIDAAEKVSHNPAYTCELFGGIF